MLFFVFFFKQKTAYEMRISDWSSDVCSSDLAGYTQPIQMRVEELISGVRATLALKLYGEDLAELDRISGELKNVLATVPGVADLSLEANLGKPQIRIKVDRAEMARHSMNAEPVLTKIERAHV